MAVQNYITSQTWFILYDYVHSNSGSHKLQMHHAVEISTSTPLASILNWYTKVEIGNVVALCQTYTIICYINNFEKRKSNHCFNFFWHVHIFGTQTFLCAGILIHQSRSIFFTSTHWRDVLFHDLLHPWDSIQLLLLSHNSIWIQMSCPISTTGISIHFKSNKLLSLQNIFYYIIHRNELSLIWTMGIFFVLGKQRNYCSSPHYWFYVALHILINCRCLVLIPANILGIICLQYENFINCILQDVHQSSKLAPIIFIWFSLSCA